MRWPELSSPVSFEVLHAVSQRLADDFIDEDMSELQLRNRTVTNRMVTVRGRHRGRAVVLQYSDYYSETLSSHAPLVYERNVLELFVAQPRVTFDGTCRSRTAWDRFIRLFGAGGLKGDSPVFDACRLEATDDGNLACLQHRPFADLLQRLAQGPSCLRVKMQAGAGVGPLLRFSERQTPDLVMACLEQTVQLVATLDA